MTSKGVDQALLDGAAVHETDGAHPRPAGPPGVGGVGGDFRVCRPRREEGEGGDREPPATALRPPVGSPGPHGVGGGRDTRRRRQCCAGHVCDTGRASRPSSLHPGPGHPATQDAGGRWLEVPAPRSADLRESCEGVFEVGGEVAVKVIERRGDARTVLTSRGPAPRPTVNQGGVTCWEHLGQGQVVPATSIGTRVATFSVMRS